LARLFGLGYEVFDSKDDFKEWLRLNKAMVLGVIPQTAKYGKKTVSHGSDYFVPETASNIKMLKEVAARLRQADPNIIITPYFHFGLVPLDDPDVNIYSDSRVILATGKKGSDINIKAKEKADSDVDTRF